MHASTFNYFSIVDDSNLRIYILSNIPNGKFLGIFIFYSIQSFLNTETTLILNILLICFLLYFIWGKIKNFKENIEITDQKHKSKSIVIAQTLGFTFLNPHVYSDTVFMLGNLSKSLQFFHQKIAFGLGASLASILFFYSIGYGSYFLRSFFLNKKIWNITNVIIITVSYTHLTLPTKRIV